MSYKSEKVPIYDPITGYDRLATHYQHHHRKLDTWIGRQWLQFLPRDLTNCTILDIGGGDGRLIKYFKQLPYQNYMVFDGSQVLLDHCPRAHKLHKLQGDLEQKRIITDQSIDIALCFFVLGHIADLRHRAEQLYRVMKIGGTAIIQYHYESKPYLHHIGADIYKIQTYQHDLQDIITELQYVGMQVYQHDITQHNTLVSRILVCHK